MRTARSAVRIFVVGGVLGAGVMAGGALAVAQSGTTAAQPSGDPGTTTTVPVPDREPGDCERGQRRLGAMGQHRVGAEELAAELGVTVDAVNDARTAARQAVREELGRPARPSDRPRSDEERDEQRQVRVDRHDQAMAESLGITVERLREARVAVLSEHLDEAVTDGRLSREEADERLERARQGDEGPVGGWTDGQRHGGRHGEGPRRGR
jgi:hypothetical protein